VVANDWTTLVGTALRRDVAEARKLARRWVGVARRSTDARELGLALLHLADANQVAGRMVESDAAYTEAQEVFLQAGQRRPAWAVRLGALQVRALLGQRAVFLRDLRALRRALPDARARVEQAGGNGWRALGDEQRAEECFRAALESIKGRRDARSVILRAHLLQDLGVALASCGDPRAGLRELARARAVFERSDLRHSVLMCEANIAWAQGVAGDLRGAWTGLRSAADALFATGDRRRAALARLDAAELRLRLGDSAAAAAEGAQQARWLARVGIAFDAARAWLLVARAHRMSELPGPAKRAAKRAASLLESVGGVAFAALVRQYGGEPDRDASRRLRDAGHIGAAFEATLDASESMDPRKGAAWLEREARAYPPALRQSLAPERLRLSAAGEQKRRIPLLRRALRAAETVRSSAPTSRFRATALMRHHAVYEELAQALLERGRPADLAEAFWVLDAARARTLREELEREAPGILDAPRARELRERIEALWHAMEEREREPRDLRGGPRDILREIHTHERALVTMLGEEHAPPAMAPAQSAHTGCLAYACVASRLVGFLADADGVRTWDAGSVAHARADLGDLRFQVERHHYGGVDAGSTDAILAGLAERLFGTIESLPPRLRVVLPRELGAAPIEALPWRGAPLIEHVEIEHAPCAGWRGRRWRSAGGSLLVALGSRALPDVEREVDSIEQLVPGAQCLRGSDASRDGILASLQGQRVIHIAGHARARDDLPPLSALRVRDGWLTASDLARAQLCGSLVVLSACRTGDPSMGWQGESWGGFPRALIAAGAGGVVASRWPVRDEAARAWMERFYRALPDVGPAAAVSRASLEVRAERPHLADWAAFLLVRGGVG